MWQERGENDHISGQRVPRERMVRLLRAFALGAALSAAWGLISMLLPFHTYFSFEDQDRMFSRPIAMQILRYGILSPVFEEIVFRFLLYDLARKVFPPRVCAVIVSAVFAIWHGQVIVAIYAFAMGLLLQHLRSKNGDLLEPIFCHMGANLLSITVEAVLS